MKAKFVNEAIKHLAGRSEEEMRKELEKFPLWQQFMIAKDLIRITAEEHENMKKSMERVIQKALNHVHIKKYELIKFEDVKVNDHVVVFAYNSIEGFCGNTGTITYVSTTNGLYGEKLPNNFVLTTSSGMGERFHEYNVWGIAKTPKKLPENYYYQLTIFLQSAG